MPQDCGDCGADTKGFHFLCWDTEQIFEGNHDNNLTVNNHSSPTGIFHSLLQNKKFVTRYLKRANDILAEELGLTTDAVQEDIKSRILALASLDQLIDVKLS